MAPNWPERLLVTSTQRVRQDRLKRQSCHHLPSSSSYHHPLVQLLADQGVSPKVDKQLGFRSGFEKLNNSLVDGILILFQPGSHVVVDHSCIMGHTKMSILVSLGSRLQENWKFS